MLFQPFGGALPAAFGGGSPVRFSAAAAATTPPADGKESSTKDDGRSSKDSGKDEKSEKDKKKDKDDDSNLFLDNLGKIFLAAIGGVVLMLVRSSRGTANKTAVRDRIESLSVLDPLEIDDLRVANSELTVEVWDDIVGEVGGAFPDGRASYQDFVSVVVQTMRRLKGNAFTVQLGHYLDRVVVELLDDMEEADAAKAKQGAEPSALDAAADAGSGDRTRKDLPLSLLLTVLSLALNAGVNDRVKALFDVMKRYSVEDDTGDTVSEDDVVRMVGYLQQTCQLVPDAQIVYGEMKYPVQQYRRGNATELVAGGSKIMAEEGTKGEAGEKEGDGGGGDDACTYDMTEFQRLLRTKSVCAWGECYVKKRGLD